MEYNNFKNPDAGCDKYGKYRLELALEMKKILNQLTYTWFIENGTLLGAYRNNKFIAHDDDFDIGILISDLNEINILFNKIKKVLSEKYELRIIDTYSNKIEVFDPSFGNYILSGPQYNNQDYHYVTIDLQFYLKQNDKYKLLYFINNSSELYLEEEIIKPTNLIELEGEVFPTPNKVKIFLERNYGSIDPRAKYNKETCKYEI
jgi:phosphorylcholine metabolism protein LicD